MQIKKQTHKKQTKTKNKQTKNAKLQETPPTNDFDDSPYPNDTLKFRYIIVKRCKGYPEKLLQKKITGGFSYPIPLWRTRVKENVHHTGNFTPPQVQAFIFCWVQRIL